MSILTHSDRISREPEGKVHITFICMITLATIPHEAATEMRGTAGRNYGQGDRTDAQADRNNRTAEKNPARRLKVCFTV